MWKSFSGKVVFLDVFSISSHSDALFGTPCVFLKKYTRMLTAICLNTIVLSQRIPEPDFIFCDGTPMGHKSANYNDFCSVHKLSGLCWGEKCCSPRALSNRFCPLFSSTHCWLRWPPYYFIIRISHHSDKRMRSIFPALHPVDHNIYASWDHWVFYRLAPLLRIPFCLCLFVGSSRTVHGNCVYASTFLFYCQRASFSTQTSVISSSCSIHHPLHATFLPSPRHPLVIRSPLPIVSCRELEVSMFLVLENFPSTIFWPPPTPTGLPINYEMMKKNGILF